MLGIPSRGRFAVALLAVVLLSLGSAAAAVASNAPVAQTNDPNTTDTYISSLDPTVLQNQNDLMAYKTWLVAQPGIYNAGLVETANDAANRSTTFLWAGGDNATLTAVEAEAAAHGITTSVLPVRYSRSQLEAGIAHLWASANDSSWSGFQIASISGTDLTHDGLTVTGYFSGSVKPLTEGGLTAVARTVLAQVPALHSFGSDPLSVNVTWGQKPSLYVTRSTDTSPFNAGGLIEGSDDSFCSSGFSINFKNETHTITARHCNATPYHAYNLSSSVYGSTAIDVNPGGARLLTGHGSGLMFDGAENNAAGYTKSVTGFADLSLNDHVCTSGGNSGVHCGVKVTSLSVEFNDGYGYVQTIRGIQQTAGAIAAAQGDSGGPVLVPLPGGSDVHAAGMIQGSLGKLITSCGTVHVAVQCSTEVEFSSTRTIVDGFAGATLVTN